MTPEQWPRELSTFVLESSRIGGLLVACPLPWKYAPARLRAVLTLAIALVAHGSLRPDTHALSGPRVLLAIPTELLVGIAMGSVVAIALTAAETYAELVGPMFGLSIPSVFDPVHAVQSTVLSRVLVLLMTLVAVIIGVHRTMIGAVLASFRLMPPGAALDPSVAALPLLNMVADALVMGVRMGLPLAAVLLLTQAVLAFLSRAAPSMQVFSVGFAASLLVGTAVFLLVLPDSVSAMAADLATTGTRLQRVFAALAAR